MNFFNWSKPFKVLVYNTPIAIAGDSIFLRLLSDFNAKLSRQEAEVRSSVYKITEKDFFTEWSMSIKSYIGQDPTR